MHIQNLIIYKIYILIYNLAAVYIQLKATLNGLHIHNQITRQNLIGWHGIALCGMAGWFVWYSSVWFGWLADWLMRHSTMWFGQLFNSMVLHGVVHWCGMELCDTAYCLFGMVLCDIIGCQDNIVWYGWMTG